MGQSILRSGTSLGALPKSPQYYTDGQLLKMDQKFGVPWILKEWNGGSRASTKRVNDSFI